MISRLFSTEPDVSVTIVALQLASSQFTPRVLRGFMADRANQLVLGIFIGTFTYAVMVLRTVTGEDESGPAFVPEVAVTMAIVFDVCLLLLQALLSPWRSASVQQSTKSTRFFEMFRRTAT